MADTLYALSQQDAQLLRRILAQYRQTGNLPPLGPAGRPPPARVYIGTTQAAIASEASGSVEIRRLNSAGTATETISYGGSTLKITAYNPFTTTIASGKRVVIAQDPWGTYWITAEDC